MTSAEGVIETAEPYSAPFLLEALLREQQATAVESFAQWHDRQATALGNGHYTNLLPLSRPGPGEQYAFEVDLDACSGCKACVTACHNLNGLEPDEAWRSVGMLHGGSTQLPILQHITSACHHCVDPACLDGCPVNAYEKDPVTGIVRHLDDQCIGCQYCILKCPYDVPKYSPSKGIIRKCDMCHQRLAVGEAPACVQACPNHAIRITLVNKQDVAEIAEANHFLPGAPAPGYTLPTTIYKSQKPLPANLLPADYYSAAPQHAHWPLVLMLVFTQMSVGAFVVNQLVGPTVTSGADAVYLLAAFGLGLIGLIASVFHLGRPLLAYRAIIGWRTSWLSREVLAFGAFAGLAALYAATPWLGLIGLEMPAAWERGLGAAVAIAGLAAVGCSVMIYASTRRPFWNAPYTAFKFLLTCQVLGLPVALLIEFAAAAWSGPGQVSHVMTAAGVTLCEWLIAASLLKLAGEAAIFAWLRARQFTPLRRTAHLLTGDLLQLTQARFALGIAGGVLLPLLLLAVGQGPAVNPLLAVLTVVLMLGVNLAGELLERYLFFTAVVSPKMPGTPVP